MIKKRAINPKAVLISLKLTPKASEYIKKLKRSAIKKAFISK